MEKQNKESIILVTNIPTPYRIDLFKEMQNQINTKFNMDFQVWFMSDTEPTRHWKIDKTSLKFNNKFFKGLHPTIKGIPYHLNIGMLLELNKIRPKYLIVGGAWVFPSTILIAYLKRFLFPTTKMIFWSEAHLVNKNSENKLLKSIKTSIFSKFDGFIVPGAKALQYVKNYSKNNKKVLVLPNTVDERKFHYKVKELRSNRREQIRESLGVKNSELLLILPARLIEVKGIIPFLKALRESETLSNFKLFIAGDGVLKDSIESEIKNGLEKIVYLMGHVDEMKMLELYAAADIFVLPSIYDASPLTVVEALWAGLPLLLSTGVGNNEEALINEENGWLFDIKNKNDTIRVIEKALSTDKEILKTYGRKSEEISFCNFDKETQVEKLLNKLINNL